MELKRQIHVKMQNRLHFVSGLAALVRPCYGIIPGGLGEDRKRADLCPLAGTRPWGIPWGGCSVERSVGRSQQS